jgi:hypothetical protein
LIVSKIYGGLAGQMTQYAVGRHLSLINKTDLYLDLSWFSYNSNLEFPREFRLNKLRTHYQIADTKKILWKFRFTEKYKQINPLKLVCYHEQDYTVFNPDVLKLRNGVILDGYFFSYKYFEKILPLLEKEFAIKEMLDERNQRQLYKIKNTNSVSVHFRRGDYALSSFHGMLQIEYYQKALKYLSDKFSDIHLFLFSDDIGWAKKNILFDYPFEIIDYNGDKFNYIDMELMKNCKHNIIANSGFSWWAGILNKNKDAIIIGPKKWVNQSKHPINHIPPGWILF